MVNLSDQLNLALCLPIDPRLANYKISENTIIVESIYEYLARVDLNSRYIGMEIKWIEPAGIYEINDFINKITSEYFTTKVYSFKLSIRDENLIEVVYGITIDPALSETSANAVENRAVALVINQILSVIAEHPTYIAPSISLNNITKTIETGSNISENLVITFNQNDAGSVTGRKIFKDGVEIADNVNTVNVTQNNVTSVINFNCQVCYGDGIVKNNNLGIADNYGQILAGCITSANRTITPQLKHFWGNRSSTPTTSAEVRALSNNTFSTTNSITLSTGTINTKFVVCIPSTRSITKVIDSSNLNADITLNYVLINNNFNVLDAGGNARSYKMYVMSTSVPYSTSVNHIITIG